MTNHHDPLGRRAVLTGAHGTAGALALAAPADASPRPRCPPCSSRPTNPGAPTTSARSSPRPHGAAYGSPSSSPTCPGSTSDETVPVATPRDAPRADLLVVTGADDWPLECAWRFGGLPRAASSLAYLGPDEAPGADRVRRGLRLVTSSSPAEARAFGGYLGTRRRVRVVGSPQTDDLPERRPEPGLVLVVTSVTRSDETGGAAPGTELLLAAAERLRAAGKRILVGLHPREDRSLWERYEISDVPTLRASARAEAAIGVPGTIFPLIAAVGTPVVGCTDPALSVPDYLLSVCSATIGAADEAVPAVAAAGPPDPAVLADAVGPVGGSAGRLLDAWARAARPRRH
ncbi:hypothetical protein [Actinomadura sp. CNU-125]|uniref:hypothetical protein n=1 Tax=Actinomadura sp. CNU-125 TaxID=1904961 RepID=UPI000A529358|nr:hypothetical protein [Actinomadura sp. CNU-125]